MNKRKRITTPHPERKRFSALKKYLISEKNNDFGNKDDFKDFSHTLDPSCSTWYTDSNSESDSSEDSWDDIDDDFSLSDSESTEFSSPENPRFSDGMFAERGISPAIYPKSNANLLDLDLSFGDPKLTSTQLECQNVNLSYPVYNTPKARSSKKPRHLFDSTDSDTVDNNLTFVQNKRVPIIASSDTDETVTTVQVPREQQETIIDSNRFDIEPPIISPIGMYNIPVTVDEAYIKCTDVINFDPDEADRTTEEIIPERLELELEIETENSKNQETSQRQECDVNNSKKGRIINKILSWFEDQNNDSPNTTEVIYPERLETELDIENDNSKNEETQQRQNCDVNNSKEGGIFSKRLNWLQDQNNDSSNATEEIELDIETDNKKNQETPHRQESKLHYSKEGKGFYTLPIWLQELKKDAQDAALSCITTLNTEDIVDNVFKDSDETSFLNFNFARISAQDLSELIVDSVQHNEVKEQSRKNSSRRKPDTIKGKYKLRSDGNETISNSAKSGSLKNKKSNKNKKKKGGKNIELRSSDTASFDADHISSLLSCENVDAEVEEECSSAVNSNEKKLDGSSKKNLKRRPKERLHYNSKKLFSEKDQRKKRNPKGKKAMNSYSRSVRINPSNCGKAPNVNADRYTKLKDPYHFTSAESDFEEESILRKKSSTRKKATRTFQRDSSSGSLFGSKKKMEEEIKNQKELLESIPICPLALTKTPFFASKRVAK